MQNSSRLFLLCRLWCLFPRWAMRSFFACLFLLVEGLRLAVQELPSMSNIQTPASKPVNLRGQSATDLTLLDSTCPGGKLGLSPLGTFCTVLKAYFKEEHVNHQTISRKFKKFFWFTNKQFHLAGLSKALKKTFYINFLK